LANDARAIVENKRKARLRCFDLSQELLKQAFWGLVQENNGEIALDHAIAFSPKEKGFEKQKHKIAAVVANEVRQNERLVPELS
jgi:hypothetical protein